MFEMIFKSIKATNFKGYHQIGVTFHPSINCIVGANGAGKTNLMDALYYSCFLKSYFTSSDQFVLKEAAQFFRLESKIDVNDKSHEIVVKMPAGGKKTLNFDGSDVTKRTAYLGKFPAVMIAPDDNQIILGGSELRRKFISACIAQYNMGYLQALLPYQKILRQRNAALKNFQKSGRVDETLLAAIDEQMIQHGNLLFSHRKEFINNFQPIFETIHQQLVNNSEPIEIAYKSQVEADRMEIGLQQNRQKDLITCRTNFGPHKDDLIFILKGQPLKSIGSQGQQKSYLLALKLAQYKLIQDKAKKNPFLFLDDIFDKFDEHRVLYLLAMLKNNQFGQVFITDTHEERVKSLLEKHNLDFQLIQVANGAIING